jgi:hypothetical protein
MHFEIDSVWTAVGSPVLIDDHDVVFPPLPRTAGVYQILSATHFYVGEADHLHRRFGGYRRPGGSADTKFPRTNRRVKRWIVGELEASGPSGVLIELCSTAKIRFGNGDVSQLDLGMKHSRLAIESLVIEQNIRAGRTPVNLLK